MKRGKKYLEAAKLVTRGNTYDVPEAVALIKKTATAKFDETIEAHIRLGVDGRHADQQVRGAVVLPHGTGKKVRVLVFAKGAKADEALAAGADYIADDDVIGGVVALCAIFIVRAELTVVDRVTAIAADERLVIPDTGVGFLLHIDIRCHDDGLGLCGFELLFQIVRSGDINHLAEQSADGTRFFAGGGVGIGSPALAAVKVQLILLIGAARIGSK